MMGSGKQDQGFKKIECDCEKTVRARWMQKYQTG
jgi:hypothetical protein